MHNRNAANQVRRSSRVAAAVPILVTSLEPKIHFSEVCETLVISAHGCALRSRVKLEPGVPLHLHSKDGRETTAKVVSCHPIGSNSHAWRLGARLDRPENFWGMREHPRDWAVVPPNGAAQPPAQSSAPPPAQAMREFTRGHFSASSGDNGGSVSHDHMRRMIADSVRPLEADLAVMKERLARGEANRSRFDVSLSSIPPELEQQLESRLKTELGPRVLEEASQQSTQLLAAAKRAIDEKIAEGYRDFRVQLGTELQVLEQRARDIAGEISANVHEQLRVSLGDFQQQLLEGMNQLRRVSGELLEFLQRSLNEEHNSRRAEFEEIQEKVRIESSRLNEQVEYLDRRIAKLDETARCLESDLEERLNRMAGETVSQARGQFESAADGILREMKNRGVQTLGNQLDEACGNMKIVQKGIVASVSESLKNETAAALRAFEQSMEEQAKLSVERWRLTLAGGLNALVKSLGEQFRAEAVSEFEQPGR
ncbi:MAG: hypothetical protein JO159_02460 [Acidobacteria bacterium]|nr:hypothetical protein [Acidobacteriota bacterium]